MSLISRTPRTVLGALVAGVLDPGAATRILCVVRAREASSLRDLARWVRPEATGRPRTITLVEPGAPRAGAVTGVPDRTITLTRSDHSAASSRADHHTIELTRPPGGSWQPRDAAERAVRWAAEAGREVNADALVDVLTSDPDPLAENLFFRFLDRLGVVPL
ncbi:hypothetical protein [Streptomyces caelestis]|uniref:hypothetical protein n=1 Tax=Streptomyces caelestis TaxID=36816 RepID=UPI0036FCF99F